MKNSRKQSGAGWKPPIPPSPHKARVYRAAVAIMETDSEPAADRVFEEHWQELADAARGWLANERK